MRFEIVIKSLANLISEPLKYISCGFSVINCVQNTKKQALIWHMSEKLQFCFTVTLFHQRLKFHYII